MIDYIANYKLMLPEMNEKQLRKQKTLFEANYKTAGNQWHGTDLAI
jgi:hypothetical protein